MWGKQSSDDEFVSRPRARTRDRGVDDLDDDLPSSTRYTTSPSRLSTAMLDLWNDLPDHVKKDPTMVQLKASLPGTSAGLSRPSELSDVTEEGDLTPRLTFPDDLGEAGTGGKGKEFLSNVSVAASLHASRGKHGHSHGHESLHHHVMPGEKSMRPWIRWVRMLLLLITWTIFTWILMTRREREQENHQISVPKNQIKSYLMHEMPTENQVAVTIGGALLPPAYGNLTESFMEVWVELIQTKMQLTEAQRSNVSLHINKTDILFTKNLTAPWRIPLVSAESIDGVPKLEQDHEFNLDDFEIASIPRSLLRLQMHTNLHISFPVSIRYDTSPITLEDGVVYAAVVLVGLYAMVIFEIVHRTLAAMIASTMSVAILAAFNERPSMAELVQWIDVETLLLLFSMMVLVAIFSETGIFDYMAVYAYKITGGKIWPLINTLCFFTVMLSMVLDNVTTVLLMTPVSIRLCEVMELNPVPVLMSMIIYSNIGGAITPVGDPPNVILASHKEVVKAGVDFGVFTLHMGIGTLIVFVVVNIQLRFTFRNVNDFRFAEPQEVQELRHEIAIWQRAAASLSSYSRDEDSVRETLLKKARRLVLELQRKVVSGSVAVEDYKATLEDLQAKYPIRNKMLLLKSGLTILFVVVLFFLHSIPQLNLSLGWTALLGAILLLLLADQDMEGVLARVEWSTLLFFAALFVLMEALSRLKLIEWIGKQTESLILAVPKDYQLAMAILLILWVSALASSFVDNIPLTTMMVRIVVSLAQNEELSLPLQPLVWALAFGACLGGNGTLIGSSSNVVCAGVAEQHGYRFTFVQFFKVGFPVVVVSVLTITVYLMIAHVALGWNGNV
ncbi:P protein [Thrips palmi]|uniref:P protein n=1 Tax=Thrips palmi TaxID=161013 RepID=A0A6P8YKY6_THRPL|nr:P protein [Thrips palmi]XP_034234647.1 P protein [Thrips palmi]XP_034234648.1 P protein [Thrips palmi]